MMAGDEGKALGIEVFDYTDFGFWILDNVDWELYIWEEITSTTLGELPDDMEDTDWQLLNRQVWGLFDLPCQDQHNIVKEKTT